MSDGSGASAAVYRLIEQAGAQQTTAPLFTEQARRHAVELAEAVDTGGEVPVAQVYVLGLFHWLRYDSRPADPELDDLRRAMRLFEIVHRQAPQALPGPLAGLFPPSADSTPAIVVDPDRSNALAADLFHAYERYGGTSLLYQAVSLFRGAAAATAPGPERTYRLANLGGALYTLFERTGRVELLTESIQLCRDAVAATSEDDPDRCMRLANLSAVTNALSEATGDSSLLFEAVRIGREALAAAPTDRAMRGVLLSNLSDLLQDLFDRAKRIELLEEAVDRGRAAVAVTPAERGVDVIRALTHLGNGLASLSRNTGELAPLAEAVQVKRQAVALTTADSPYRGKCLSNLANALAALAERTGQLELLEEAVQAGADALAAVPEGHPDRALALSNLGLKLRALYLRTGDLDLPVEAVRVSREAVAATPVGHADRALYLNNLSVSLRTLFGRTGQDELLAEAVRTGREAVATAPQDHPERVTFVNSLGITLAQLFSHTRQTDALVEAVRLGRDAVAALPDNHADKAKCLNSLGISLRTLFEYTGRIELLKEAVDASRKAVIATAEANPDRADYLNSLGGSLQKLYESTGQTEVLVEAVQAGRDAAGASPANHPFRALYLCNLGGALQRLFDRTQRAADLAEAVEAGRESVRTAPRDHPNRALLLASFGSALQEAFDQTGRTQYLSEAVRIKRDALAALPLGHVHRVGYLSNLSTSLITRFRSLGEIDDLAEAVQVGRDAVAAAPDDYIDKEKSLSNLGLALTLLFEQTGKPEHLEEARQCFRLIVANPLGSPGRRITAYRQLAVLADRTERGAREALAAMEAAVALVPLALPRALDRSDREHQLGELGSFAGAAACAAVEAHDAQRAVQLLEATRGVLVADSIDARSSDLTRLREAHPELAERFESLRLRREALEVPDNAPTVITAAARIPDAGGVSWTDVLYEEAQARSRARAQAQEEWLRLVDEIQAVDGFGDFLGTPTIDDLAAQAGEGPVVFIVTSQRRCDALILSNEPGARVRSVPLEGLTEAEAYRQTARLVGATYAAADAASTPAGRRAAQQQILEVLAWLWDTVTEPVLTALGHTAARPRPDDADCPRVWWCPVGPIAAMPLHAAGHHADLLSEDPERRAEPRTVLDRVVSSYTTTVRALAYARARPARPEPRTVIVAVPDAPGTDRLAGAQEEREIISSLIPEAHILPHPTRETVLTALELEQYPIAHFACHGYADWSRPADSRLILYDHLETPLTVADLNTRHVTGALAYLSACESTMPSPRLADEALNMAGAFHLAGYARVVGTLWSVNDQVAKFLAAGFYAILTKNGTEPPDTTRAPYALHQATRELRVRYPAAASLWASHTFTGI
jgi:tetratricopeptide (TPR) repeat protein